MLLDDLVQGGENSRNCVIRGPLVVLRISRWQFLDQITHGVLAWKHVIQNKWNTMIFQRHPTNELLVALIDGEVPEGGGDGAHDAVHLHPEQLDQDGQALLLSDGRAHVYARLPVARGEILNGPGGTLERLRVRAVGEEIQVGLNNLPTTKLVSRHNWTTRER